MVSSKIHVNLAKFNAPNEFDNPCDIDCELNQREN